jgi:hypothetical protein
MIKLLRYSYHKDLNAPDPAQGELVFYVRNNVGQTLGFRCKCPDPLQIPEIVKCFKEWLTEWDVWMENS